RGRVFGPARAVDSEAISIHAVQRAVAAFFGVTVEHLKSTRRSGSVVEARHIALYLARTLTLRSFPQIGVCFGGRNHTTVMYSYEKIRDLLPVHRPTADAVRRLSAIIRKEPMAADTVSRRSRAASKRPSQHGA